MTTENEIKQALIAPMRKNAELTEIVGRIDADLDLLNARLSDDGTPTGTPDSATDSAVTAAKVQSAIIQGRNNVLFPSSKLLPEDFVFAYGSVEDAADTLIVVTMSHNGVITDETGFTISGCTSATSFTDASITDNILTLTCNAAVDDDDVPVISYNSATGNLVKDGTASDVANSVTNFPITNNVVA